MKTRPLKRYCDGPPQYGLNIAAGEYTSEGVRLIRTSDIRTDGSLSDAEQGVFVPDTVVEPRHRLQVGDILFSRSGTLGRSIRVQEAASEMTFAGFLVRFRPVAEADPRFVEYCANSAPFQAAVEADAVTSTISNFNAEKYSEVRLPDVAPDRQRAIADYLDTETARIDALIAKKQRMIELLDERLRVWISRAVTSGLDEAAVLKPSGLEYVNQIPAHWGRVPLSSVCSFEAGKAHEPFIEDEGRFICVNSRFISTAGQTVKNCSRNLSPARRSDVLLVMSDLPNGRALARAFFVDEDDIYAVNQRVCIISPHGVEPRFAFYQLDRNPYFLSYDDGSNQTHLSNSTFTKFPMLIPPAEEQRAIADFLDELTANLSRASRLLSQQIELLRERRQALITAAVTGELGVPGVAA